MPTARKVCNRRQNSDKKDRFDLFNIYLGELEAIQLAERSFCSEVSFIQCNVKKEDFLHLIPRAVEDFEFDLMVALKV